MRLLAAVVVGAVLLHLPSLAVGFYADDHVHQLALDGRAPLEPWALFDFGGVEDWRSPDGRAFEGFPWWTSPDWKIRFFRPLASASLWLDHALFGSRAAAYHVTSLAWFAALLGAAYALHRALGLSRGVATAAVALLGVSQSTAYPIAWIANRNSVIAATFTAAAVAVVAAGASRRRTRALVVGLVLALLACLAKESGVVAFAAIAAYVLLAHPDRGTPWTRRAAAVSLACAGIYVVALAAAGFGTRSAFYATPWAEPARYAANLATLVPTGVLALVTPVPADLVFLVPRTTGPIVGAGVVVGAVVAAWTAVRVGGTPAAKFLVAWTALALLPEAGAPTGERLLLTATVGASGLLALLLAATLPRAAERGRAERAAAWGLVLSAGVVEAAMTLVQVGGVVASAQDLRNKSVTADVGPRGAGTRDVLLLQSDDPLAAFALPATWASETRDADVRFAVLQTGRRGLRWTREDARTMTFETLDRPFVTDPFEVVYRSGPHAPPPGTTSRLAAATVEVLDADPAVGVRRVRVRWDEPPEGPRFRFLVPGDSRLVHVDPPAVGETVELPQAPRAHPFVR